MSQSSNLVKTSCLCYNIDMDMVGLNAGRNVRLKTNMRKTNDKIIRKILLEELAASKNMTGHPARIIPEFGVEHGNRRVDVVATVNGIMHGYEIKSDADTLDRLPEQAEAYSKVFDQVTLVVGQAHIIDAIPIIPDWWGIKLAKLYSDNKVTLLEIRPSLDNPGYDSMSIARLLWRQEALDILESIGKDAGVKSKRREIIYERLASELSLQDLRDNVREKLSIRQDWRVGQLLPQYGD